MNSHSVEHAHAVRDEPQDDADRILMLRASLRVMTDAYESLLENGPPKRGRSANDKEAHDMWWEDQYASLARARESLKLTGDAETQPEAHACRHPDCACERKVCGPDA
jgi:hypothetical protein